MLTAKIGGVLALIALIYYGVFAILENEHQAGYDAAVAKCATQALSDQAKLNSQLVEAQNAAIIRGQENKKLSNDLTASTIQLHNYTADKRKRLSTDSCEANRNTADAALAVFGECTAEYRAMAENATGHSSDYKTLDDAW